MWEIVPAEKHSAVFPFHNLATQALIWIFPINCFQNNSYALVTESIEQVRSLYPSRRPLLAPALTDVTATVTVTALGRGSSWEPGRRVLHYYKTQMLAHNVQSAMRKRFMPCHKVHETIFHPHSACSCWILGLFWLNKVCWLSFYNFPTH